MTSVINAKVTPAAAVKVTPVLPAVARAINSAVTASASMLSKTREAARMASEQLDATLPLRERIGAIMSAYSSELSKDHNVKAIFSDTLTLLACGQTEVVVNVVGKEGKMETSTTAAQAVDMSKHNLKAAARQVREAHDIGRTVKPREAKPASEAKPKAQSAPDMLSVDAFSNWLDMLPEYLGDSVFHPRIVAALIGKGYTLNKALKGRAITGV